MRRPQEVSAKADDRDAATAEKQPAEQRGISSGADAIEGEGERLAAGPAPGEETVDPAEQPAAAEDAAEAAPPPNGNPAQSAGNGSAAEAAASAEMPGSPLETANSAPPVEGEAAAGERPLFDLLRVEPDGSTLIAGRAMPGSRVTLHAGETLVGEDTANAAGEFVIVLPEPLTPGEHAISITAITPDGATSGSNQTAIVSVPQPGRGDDVLAMVEAPDEASRLVTVPGPLSRQAAGSDGPDAGTAAAGGSATAASQDEAPTPAPAAGPEQPVDTNAEAPPTPGATGEKDNAAERGTLPRLRIEAVEVEGEQIFVAGAADAGTSVRIYLDNALMAEDRATADNRFLVAAERPVAVGDHLVRADQVGADGNVTARAEVPFTRPQGRAVAAIAPDPPIAQEKIRPSPDVEAADGPAAETRVAATSPPVEDSVPVDGRAGDPAGGAADTQESGWRPDTKTGGSPQGDASTTNEGPAAGLSPDVEPAAKPEETVSETAGVLGTAEGGAESSKSTEASAAPASGPADGALPIVGNQPGELTREATDPTASTNRTSGNRPVQMVEPRSQTGVGTPEKGVDGTRADAPALPEPADTQSSTLSTASRTETKDFQPTTPPQPGSGTVGERQVSATPPEKSSAGTTESEANGTPALDIPINRQAPLATSAGRVIIRKGDTLWGISRETYGQGSRYTVIYFANGNRIRDPDLIYPGQVFRLPEVPSEPRDQCECAETSGATPQG
ncbi:LysM peptidoglycan-binding domain-containing protein [Aurantimonas marianensis]|uniref:LysM peptidoglycan-binding domain-containing protein n=1 Tax=Aurantimonas marianensis TaxID=2920428 RepID=A0A9X2H9Q2_9HYPH|nr:LysM peptidoglycan-binding domain-containing protein [Aurantimonas marianensis]MCP3056413.1 LysM peptidoglycan-binding domain-containing protein [Aurantimonas marianensis]